MTETPKQFMDQSAQLEWVIPGLPAFGGRVALSGARGLGKTLVATEMAVAIATGTPFLDTFRPWTAASVVLCTTEPREHVADRLGGFLFARCEEDAPLLRIQHGAMALDSAQGQAQIRDIVTDLRAKFVIIDPIESYFDGSTEGAVRLRTTLTALSDSIRATVVLCGDLESPALAASAGILRAWCQVVLQLREDPARRQVIMTTADREGIPGVAPLLRFVISPLRGKPRYAHLVPWPAEPLSSAEQRVYDQLRAESAPLRELRRRAHIRHDELVRTLQSLHAKGLVEPFDGVHRVGVNGRRVFRTWRALPVTARKIDDRISGEASRSGQDNSPLSDAGHTTGGKRLGPTAGEEAFWRDVRAELNYVPDSTYVPKGKPDKRRQPKSVHESRRADGLPAVHSRSRRGRDPV